MKLPVKLYVHGVFKLVLHHRLYLIQVSALAYFNNLDLRSKFLTLLIESNA
jgi:hypothetical protein